MSEYIFVGEFEHKKSGIRHSGTQSVYAKSKEEACAKFLSIENEFNYIPLKYEIVRVNAC